MERSVIKNNKQLKNGAAIKILAIISLVCTVASCVLSCFYYREEYDVSKNAFNYYLEVQPLYIWDLVSSVLILAVPVLFVLYIFKFYNKLKATILVPVVFGLIAFTPIYYFIENIISGYGYYGMNLILDIPIVVTFVLATISALKGFYKKVFLIIAIALGLIMEIWSLYSFFVILEWILSGAPNLSLFTMPVAGIGTIAIYISLLLFGLKNRIPVIISTPPEKEKAKIEKMSPEKALKLLKDKLDLDMIPEEEYQAQRAEIISKL